MCLYLGYGQIVVLLFVILMAFIGLVLFRATRKK